MRTKSAQFLIKSSGLQRCLKFIHNIICCFFLHSKSPNPSFIASNNNGYLFLPFTTHTLIMFVLDQCGFQRQIIVLARLGNEFLHLGLLLSLNSVKQRVNRSFSFTPMAYFYGRVVRNFFNQRACGFHRRRFFPSKFEQFLGYCTQHQFAIAAAL